jgi:UDP-3-O-[3-hydroxymyristoyl] N-acetylglucosamine deacetylase
MQGGNAGLELRPVVFDSQRAPGRKITQKTLKNSALLYGQGLHTGQKSGLTLEPLPANSGIHFGSVSKRGIVPSHVDFVESTGYATTVKAGEVQAGTIEHLLSALHAYQISNLLVKCNGEIPVMDGSAREFCQLFDEIGIEEQGGDWFEIEVREPVEITTPKGEFIRIEPALNFTVEYHLQYPAPVGSQVFLFSLDSKEAYKREIAPARTFGFVKDIGWLQQQGLARGGRFDNFVLFDEKGPVNCALRFPDEPVRHKVLDLIGDIYLLGRPIRGKITAKMTGHSDNIAILRALKQAMESWG